MTGARRDSLRILIGAGSFADARAALRLVERLDENLAKELGGVFVEDTMIAELADIPRQRVITSSGTVVVAPSRHQIRTVIESDANAFRQMLSGLARQHKWSFERRRGELISGLCEAAKGWDLLLLGYRETHRFSGHVILIAPPDNKSQSAGLFAEDLARALDAATVRMSLSPTPAPVSGEPTDTEFFTNEDALLARIERTHASAIVLDLSAGPLRTYDQIRRLLTAGRCPIVVIDAGKGEPSLEYSIQIPPAPSY